MKINQTKPPNLDNLPFNVKREDNYLEISSKDTSNKTTVRAHLWNEKEVKRLYELSLKIK